MNIVVCVKQTLDTAATVSVEEGKVTWGDSPLVLNPWDEFAVEEALRTKEAHGGKVSALCIGREGAKEALKQALAMGCDEAILLYDPAFSQVDTLGAATVLAKAIEHLGDIDLAFFGRASVDSATGATFTQTARRLGWPILSLVAAIEQVDPDGAEITVERMLQEGRQVVKSPLPAVVSVVKEINEPRYPSFMGIRKASKAEIPEWDMAEIGLSQEPGSKVVWPEITMPPQVDTEVEFIEGESGAAKGEELANRLLQEKVL